jgi:hypothetical protein
MIPGSGLAGPYSLDDGLGARTILPDPRHGRVEMLDLAPALAANPAFESAIRARVDQYAQFQGQMCAAIRQVERDGTALRIIAESPFGVRLSTLLAHLESGQDVLSDASMIELAANIVRAVASIHRLPGGASHGAISSAHIAVARTGAVTLTDAAFGTALQGLQRNREQLWREFGLALPSAANLPRFDQRADMCQLAAAVLAIVIRRPLRQDEYPRGVADLVILATADAHGPCLASILRMWLQQGLQLNSRPFNTAVDAERAFAEVAATVSERRAGMQAVQTLVRKLCGEPAAPPPPIKAPARPTPPRPVIPDPVPPPPQGGLGGFLRYLRI